jgi:hypothetical protein
MVHGANYIYSEVNAGIAGSGCDLSMQDMLFNNAPIIPATMKKYILIYLIFSLSIPAYNQVIKGSIADLDNQSKINFAYIYFNGTFVGTNSDKDGNFELDISRYPSMPLTISALGYYSVTLTVVSYSKPLIIFLKPKLYELKEVVISEKSNEREWKRNVKLFTDTFIGTTRNARACEITNIKDILFVSDYDTLKAFASNPILIDNRALGYKITYFLDDFILDRKNESFYFSGNIIFNEDLKYGDPEKQIFETRRKDAYLGSRMHFFRALWRNELDSASFIVKNPADENLTANNIVIQEDSRIKYLNYPEDLAICYDSELPSSYIIFIDENVNFDRNGYFDPSSVSWQGEMSLRRIADWLPYEYEVK